MRTSPLRRLLRRATVVTLLALPMAAPISAQRRRTRTVVEPDSVVQAQIDTFVLTVREMAAWAIVTPAAHIPVGGIEDSIGRMATVVGTQDVRGVTVPDSVLARFRTALGIAARRQRSRAIGLAYLARTAPPGDSRGVETVVIEVEHRSGKRANVHFPYVFEGTEQPVFGTPFTRPGTLREFMTTR